MTTLEEDGLAFDFPDGWRAGKYDEWQFYIDHFQNVCDGSKGVDFLAVHKDCAWLIEVKDFRDAPRRKALPLFLDVALKARDTLAGLAAARLHATREDEKSLAGYALTRPRVAVVFHMEQPIKPTRLHPVEDVSKLTQKLKQLLRGIDFHPRVVSLADPARYPWTVREVPSP